MITRDEILSTTIEKWQEHIEMHPGREWEVISLLLSKEIERLTDMNEYYRKLLCTRINKTPTNG